LPHDGTIAALEGDFGGLLHKLSGETAWRFSSVGAQASASKGRTVDMPELKVEEIDVLPPVEMSEENEDDEDDLDEDDEDEDEDEDEDDLDDDDLDDIDFGDDDLDDDDLDDDDGLDDEEDQEEEDEP
jgi:hypothetical protein